MAGVAQQLFEILEQFPVAGDPTVLAREPAARFRCRASCRRLAAPATSGRPPLSDARPSGPSFCHHMHACVPHEVEGKMSTSRDMWRNAK